MTEEEKQRERDLKAGAASLISESMERWQADFADVLATDPRLGEYVRAVAGAPDGHNVYELLGVIRFFEKLGRHRWNGRKVSNFIRFYERLRFSGTKGRQRYKMTPVQVWQYANIMGLEDSQGRRLTRIAWIFVPRKYSKTTSAASLAVHDLLFGDNNAQAYVGANSYEQAKICFDEIRAIMNDIDRGGKHFRVNREKIFFKDHGRDSLVRCLTANAKTQDGLFASLVILDEYAQARNTAGKNGADLKNVLTTSMGPRREPLTLIITTASDVLDGPCYHELEGVKAVLRGEIENDNLFASIFMPDVDDREDDPRTWAKVQPHLGITVQPDYYAQEWKTAQLSAENMLAFRTKLLNVFCVNDRKAWIEEDVCRSLASGWDIDKAPKRLEMFVAFDLSVHDDFSAVSYFGWDPSVKKFFSHTDYYFPEGALPKHPNRELYTMWAEGGWLKLCPGRKINVAMIGEDILRRSRNLNIKRIVYDNYKAKDLRNLLATVGNSQALTPYSQTNGSFNLPVESFEMMAYETPPKIVMNANPINTWCLLNCVIDEDRLGNKKPMKSAEYRKIDGTISMLMALGAMLEFER